MRVIVVTVPGRGVVGSTAGWRSWSVACLACTALAGVVGCSSGRVTGFAQDAGETTDAGASDGGARGVDATGMDADRADASLDARRSVDARGIVDARDVTPDAPDAAPDAPLECMSDTDCDDENPCTTAVCAVAGLCMFQTVGDGLPCGDGDLCNGDETCMSGACVPGAPLDCDDGDPCTADTCDPSIGCSHPDAMDGTPCPDGDACNGDETCTSGSCTSGTPVDCDDGLPCTLDTCDPGTGCDNPLTGGCLIADACIADGATNPANECEACIPVTSTTGYSPRASGDPCDDGDLCTTADACDGNGACASTLADCDDGNGCTIDACDPGSGACTHTVTAGCLISGTCVPDGTINPSNECEACDVSLSDTTWSSRPAGASCDDGSLCTGPDTCDGDGACTTPAVSCDDGLPCTLDTCDPGTGCDNPLTSGCLIGGTCVADGALDPTNDCRVCVPATSTTAYSDLASGTACDDGDPCTTPDECDGGGVCTSTPIDCDDGDVCNGIESCAGGVCQAGTPLVCDDMDPCTDDSCDTAAGCQFVPNGTCCTSIDMDGDGSNACDDCDDGDPNNFPGNAEVCDGQDNDCDNRADEGMSCDPCSLPVLESFNVPLRGGSRFSTTALQAGVTYCLRVSGTFDIGGPGDGLADAEYFNFSNPPTSATDTCCGGFDVGVGVDDPDSSASKSQPNSWGSFASDHVYEIQWTGDGTTIEVNFHDTRFIDNRGILSFEILGP